MGMIRSKKFFLLNHRKHAPPRLHIFEKSVLVPLPLPSEFPLDLCHLRLLSRLKHERITDELVNTHHHVHTHAIFRQNFAELALADCTDCCHVRHTVLLDNPL